MSNQRAEEEIKASAVLDFVKWLDASYEMEMYINESEGYKNIYDFHKEYMEEQMSQKKS